MITPEELYAFLPYAMRLTKNEYDAQDLLHDVYLKLVQADYIEEGKKNGFIKTALHNRFIDLTRTEGRCRRVEIMDDLCWCFQPSYEEIDLQRRQKSIIAKFLYELSDRDKMAWQLYVDGFSQKQLADVLSIPVTAASAIIFRIKDKVCSTRKKMTKRTGNANRQWDEIIESYKAGTPVIKLATKYKCAQRTIAAKLKILGIYKTFSQPIIQS